MKKSYLITIILLFSVVFAYAALQGGKGPQGDGDGEIAEKGFDMMSAAIGLLIGAIGGFFAGKMNANKQ